MVDRRSAEELVPSRRGRERRAALMTALEELLEERPIAEIEIDDIAARAGIGRSGFYFYFATKTAALAALLERIFEQLVAVATDWYEREDLDPGERVRRALRATITFWRRHARMMAAVSAASGGNEAAALWDRVQADLAARVAARIRVDQRRGLVPAAVDPTTTAQVLVGATAAAMRADVAHIVDTGRPRPHVHKTLVRVWESTLYA